MSEHTKGQWNYRRADDIQSPSSKDYKIFSDDGALVAETFELIGKHRATDQHANARRIVACVNACASIPDEKLESWMNPPEGQLGAPHGTWAQQLAAAGRKQVELLQMLDTLCNGLAWNIEHHPDVMNESDSEALQAARLLLEKFGVKS